MTRMDHEASATRLFEVVWDTLVDVLGTATTATLFRRAAKDAATRHADIEALQDLDFRRQGLEFIFVLPPSWQSGDRAVIKALGILIEDALCPLLKELTGDVVIELLKDLPELQSHGILTTQGARP